jgi:protein-S-isoprenylcysteine O-methyltransferase Ste14
MHVVDFVIFIGWALFWVFWLAAAIGVKSSGTHWFAGLRIVALIVVVLVVRLAILPGHSAVSSPWPQGLGLGVFCVGLALAVWARLYLGHNWGMPMSQKTDPELITSGPYRRVRHPIYAGIMLGMAGTAIAVSVYWLIAAALIGAYFIYSAVQEERYMADRFPDAYPDYKRSTKMLIPFLF